MSKSMPPPWLKAWTMDLLKPLEDDLSTYSTSKNRHAVNNKSPSARVVQIVAVNDEARSFLINDKENTIVAMLTDEAYASITEDRPLSDLKGCLVKLQSGKYHLNCVMLCCGSRDIRKLRGSHSSFNLSVPLAMVVDGLLLMGAQDCNVFTTTSGADPVDVNLMPEIRDLIRSMMFPVMVHRLSTRQFPYAGGYLPDGNGKFLLAPPFSVDNPLQPQHASISTRERVLLDRMVGFDRMATIKVLSAANDSLKSVNNESSTEGDGEVREGGADREASMGSQNSAINNLSNQSSSSGSHESRVVREPDTQVDSESPASVLGQAERDEQAMAYVQSLMLSNTDDNVADTSSTHLDPSGGNTLALEDGTQLDEDDANKGLMSAAAADTAQPVAKVPLFGGTDSSTPLNDDAKLLKVGGEAAAVAQPEPATQQDSDDDDDDDDELEPLSLDACGPNMSVPDDVAVNAATHEKSSKVGNIEAWKVDLPKFVYTNVPISSSGHAQLKLRGSDAVQERYVKVKQARTPLVWVDVNIVTREDGRVYFYHNNYEATLKNAMHNPAATAQRWLALSHGEDVTDEVPDPLYPAPINLAELQSVSVSKKKAKDGHRLQLKGSEDVEAIKLRFSSDRVCKDWCKNLRAWSTYQKARTTWLRDCALLRKQVAEWALKPSPMSPPMAQISQASSSSTMTKASQLPKPGEEAIVGTNVGGGLPVLSELTQSQTQGVGAADTTAESQMTQDPASQGILGDHADLGLMTQDINLLLIEQERWLDNSASVQAADSVNRNHDFFSNAMTQDVPETHLPETQAQDSQGSSPEIEKVSGLNDLNSSSNSKIINSSRKAKENADEAVEAHPMSSPKKSKVGSSSELGKGEEDQTEVADSLSKSESMLQQKSQLNTSMRAPKGGKAAPVVEVSSLLGRQVYKEFPGHGNFYGEIVNFTKPFYKVIYEDGDAEELELAGLTKLLVPIPTDSSRQSTGPSASSASTTLSNSPKLSSQKSPLQAASSSALAPARVQRNLFPVDREVEIGANHENPEIEDTDAVEVLTQPQLPTSDSQRTRPKGPIRGRPSTFLAAQALERRRDSVQEVLDKPQTAVGGMKESSLRSIGLNKSRSETIPTKSPRQEQTAFGMSLSNSLQHRRNSLSREQEPSRKRRLSATFRESESPPVNRTNSQNSTQSSDLSQSSGGPLAKKRRASGGFPTLNLPPRGPQLTGDDGAGGSLTLGLSRRPSLGNRAHDPVGGNGNGERPMNKVERALALLKKSRQPKVPRTTGSGLRRRIL